MAPRRTLIGKEQVRWPETERKTGKDRVPGRESTRAEYTGQELREDPLEEETAPPAVSFLENPLGSGAGGLQSTWSHRV